MIIKQAYEIYSLTGGGYTKRQMHGYAWTKDEAHKIGQATHRHFYVSIVHLVKVNEYWHRIHVLPVEHVEGTYEKAEDSRICVSELPTRAMPAMYAQIDKMKPRRLSLDIEKSLDTIAAEGAQGTTCRLFTLRLGGRAPMTFEIQDLLNDPVIQERVYGWLKHETEIRKEHYHEAT